MYWYGIGLAIAIGIAFAFITELVTEWWNERKYNKDKEAVAEAILADPFLLARVLFPVAPECDDLMCGRCRACQSFDDYVHGYEMTDEERLLEAFPNAVEVKDNDDCPPHGIPRP